LHAYGCIGLLAKVRDVYQWLAKREKRFVIVDASRPLETVARDVAGILAAK